jgi:tRNA(Ile)-lysidine synthase
MPGRFGVAVSGGPDSMALLALAHKCLPGRIEAATIDHGLRPESAQEAAMVAFWCADRAIPHATLKPAEPITGNIQSTARAARYALLERWREERDIDWLLTAHHADDQLETLLMRLNRGAGVSGLAGIRGRSGTLLRPLLGWRKAELVEYAEAEGLPFVHDPSNSDPRFDRAALRARLAGVDWLDPERASRSAAALAEAEEALDWLTRDLAARHVSRAGDVLCLSTTGFPREVLRRLVLHMLDMADPDSTPPRGDTLDDAIIRLREGGKVSIGRWLLAGGEQWTLSPAPPRRDASR